MAAALGAMRGVYQNQSINRARGRQGKTRQGKRGEGGGRAKKTHVYRLYNIPQNDTQANRLRDSDQNNG